MRDEEERVERAFRAHRQGAPAVVASAPGRVNLIGEHTDYNDGFALPCAIDRRVAIALAPGEGRLYSDDMHEERALAEEHDGSWADYPRAVRWSLRQSGYEIEPFDAAFAGDVPIGSGLSSSAAIECATGIALDALGGLGIERTALARLMQRAENGYIGVQSGILDQYASLLCRAGSALLIDCRSLAAETIPFDPESAGLTLVVCDTRQERSLAGSAYNDRRATCERAAAELGVASLRDATPADLERLGGKELQRARHVVTENGRVLAAVDALRAGDYASFGRLMYESHRSLRDDYEVSVPVLDTVVEVARDMGALGARLTGAGFGGCAIVLIDTARVDALTASVLRAFEERRLGTPELYPVRPAAGADVAASNPTGPDTT